MTRTKAFLIHLGISGLIFLALLYFIVFIWYPQPYFAADGGWQGIRLVTAIDLVLGPLLTLIVFKSGKPGLKLDLTFIALVQFTALLWGTWTIYDQRTAMVTYAGGMFFTMNTDMVNTAGDRPRALLAQAENEPVYAIVSLPEDMQARRDLLRKHGPKPLYFLGGAYLPLEKSNHTEIFSQSLDVRSITQQSAGAKKIVDDFLARHTGSVSDYAFVPVFCRYATRVLVLQRTDGKVVDALDLNR
jgi:hypothetical protein